MGALVSRWGRTGFALAASVLWLLPMSAWAGTVDLYPGPRPWAAFGVGLAMLAVWALLVAWSRRVRVEPRAHRFDVGRMGTAERGWLAGCAGCAVVVVGWLNGAATVDWSLLRWGPATALFLAALAALLLAAIGGAVLCWRRASAAFGSRLGQDPQ